MAISNSSIIIKRSLTTPVPSSAKQGEMAYSYASNTLFIGTPDGVGVVNVGGQYYTSTLDASTSQNTASTLVKRDVNGSFYGRLYGNANTASTLITPRNFNISGGDITASAQSFDGSSAITLNASLNSVPGLTAGYYGGSTPSSSTIPVVQVAANGRIMSISNTTVTSSFNISDGTTSSQLQSGNTFLHLGTKGIVTAVSQNTVTFSTDNTVVRSNTTSVGPQYINTALTVANDLYVTGNLNVTGNTTYIHTTNTIVDDPMIYLAGNNYSSDIVNIGWAANYYDGTDEKHTGFYRAYDSKQYYLFDNYVTELSGNNQIDRANSYFHVATLNANVIASSLVATTATINTANVTVDFGVGGNQYVNGNQVVTGTTKLTGKANTVNDLGVGGNQYVTGSQFVNQSLVVSGSTSLTGQANVTHDIGISGNLYTYTTIVANRGLYSTNNFTGSYYNDGIVVDYVDGNGRISVGTGDGLTVYTGGPGVTPIFNVSSSGIIKTGTWQASTVGIQYGGTNSTSSNFTNNTLTYFNGTGIVSLANVSFTSTGSGATNNTITSVTVDNYGRTSALTYSAIAGLTVPQGGTGFATAQSNGLVFGNGTGPLQVTAAAGSSDQTWTNQIMTVTNAGVPVWSSALDGGVF
jgi:hypothetical protein